MVINTGKVKQEVFYLHSKINRHRYPSSKYPLTHLLDHQSIERRRLKHVEYFKNGRFSLVGLMMFTLISAIIFQWSNYVYNVFYGPFHVNLEQFIEHVTIYKDDSSWFWRKEYFQTELGEDNIQNQVPKYESSQKNSDLRAAQKHIATFKNLKIPKILVKLPDFKNEYVQKKFPFDFSSHSFSTLQCIVGNMPSNSIFIQETWMDKSYYVEHINKKYSENPFKFNAAVLTKCGALIGYLYKPVNEKVFILNMSYKLHASNLTFDATRSYYSPDKLTIGGVIFVLLLLRFSFGVIVYMSNIIRFKLFSKYRLLSFPLDLLPDVLDQLSLLNIDGSPYVQLLQLDEFIQQYVHRCNSQVYVIKNHLAQLFVIILRKNSSQSLSATDILSPFIILPVSEIRKITEDGGICYGESFSWTPWPTMHQYIPHCSSWLHEKLMQISEDYNLK